MRWGLPEGLSQGLQKGQAPAGGGMLLPWSSACPGLRGAGQRWERTPFPPRPTSAGQHYNAGASCFQFYFCRTTEAGSAGRRAHHPLTSHVVSGKEQGIPFFFLHFLLNLGDSSQEKYPAEAQAPAFVFTQVMEWFWAHLILKALHIFTHSHTCAKHKRFVR